MFARSILLNEFDYIGVMALFQDTNLSLQNLLLAFTELFRFYHFDGHELT